MRLKRSVNKSAESADFLTNVNKSAPGADLGIKRIFRLIKEDDEVLDAEFVDEGSNSPLISLVAEKLTNVKKSEMFSDFLTNVNKSENISDLGIVDVLELIRGEEQVLEAELVEEEEDIEVVPSSTPKPIVGEPSSKSDPNRYHTY
jgi:hypothetical protein